MIDDAFIKLSQDKTGSESLVNTGGSALSLDTTLNHVRYACCSPLIKSIWHSFFFSYPSSSFSNIRSNAGRSKSASAPSSSLSEVASPAKAGSTPSPSSSSSTSATPKSGQCSGVAAFSSSVHCADKSLKSQVSRSFSRLGGLYGRQ